ncbi:MAG: glycosyltransferase family 39 protein [Verrucomicrobiae bacterium]|nr:glycosyltransferase family 39 protein [Verrucomicrobiae bacterium]
MRFTVVGTLQELIYKLEVGSGARLIRLFFFFLAVLFLLVVYNWRAYRNMSAQEAMDAAQLARNIATGKGYSTLFIRPLSIYLLTNSYRGPVLTEDQSKPVDPARLKGPHPDLANPPVYPVVLAGLMKLLPFQYDIPVPGPEGESKGRSSFWQRHGRFWWYQPDFLIALFNQLLFFGAVALTYFIARSVFDAAVARLAAVLLLGTELLWRFSVSGLSTMLLLIVFLGLVWMLVRLERESRSVNQSTFTPWLLTAMAGLLVGLGALTRYSFMWVIVPVVMFLALFSSRDRWVRCLLAVAVFAAVLGPWIIRNMALCGQPFGTATYAVLETTAAFPQDKLQRSLAPSVSTFGLALVWYKFLGNLRQIVQTELPTLSGNWMAAFFLAGLLLQFKDPGRNRLKYFALMCLGLFVIVQAFGRTQLSEDSPQVNSENLLVLLVPLVTIYGAALFFVLLEQLDLPMAVLRHVVTGAFVAVMWLPMILVLLPPRSSPIVYPPYYPPTIQRVCNWMGKDDLMMSDAPWAVAWYGQRPCVWLTLDARSDFFAINDYMRPIRALYLTPRTMNGRFLTDWVLQPGYSWGEFVLESIVRRDVPPYFPLRKSPDGLMPEHLFLTDWERWRKP